VAPKPLTREELEELAGEPLPDRVVMSLMDVGVVLIGAPPGPDIPEAVPEQAAADESAPVDRIQ
jgi:hypothetical protein